MSDIKSILNQRASPDPESAKTLFLVIYHELQRLAHARLAHEPSDCSWSASDLVHETYLRLVGKPASQAQQWEGKNHFFAAAAKAMQRLVIERARRRRHCRKIGQDDGPEISICGHLDDQEHRIDLMALEDALLKLEAAYPLNAEITRLRFFCCLSHEDIAEILNLSTITVKRRWRFTRAWLHRELKTGESTG